MRYLIGQQIENYKVESVIGDGGMGTVCRAIDVDLDRPVALKIMHPQYLAQTEFQERFQQEAKAAARLSHPSIVSIYRFGRTEDFLYIVMELVEGISLGEYIEQAAQTQQMVRLNETLIMMAQVADALGYAHRHGVIHRDVKPDNVLIKKLEDAERPGDPPLRAVVTDFGLAKLMEGGVQTQTGTFIGTLPYMSPEQVMGKPLDGRSDIYSLGVVLYQLATGQLPFDIQTPTDAVLQHLNSQPPEPHLIRPGLPFAVERIILTALAKEPEYRYQTSSEMAQELRIAAAQLSDSDIASLGAQSKALSMLTKFEVAKPEETTAKEEPLSFAESPPENTNLPLAEIVQPTPNKRDDLVTSFPEATQRPSLQPDAFAQVVVTPGDGQPRTYPLDQPQIRVGRAPENDLVLPSRGVSHFHALLAQTPQGWHITDLDSTNGVFLDGRKLTPQQPTPWPPQAMVRISDNWLQLLPGQPDSGDPMADMPAASAWTPPPKPPRVRVRLPVDRLAVAPGGSAALTVLVHNQGDFADSFAVTVEGLAKAWLPARAPLVKLAVGEQREVTIPIQPPRDGAPQGSYPFVVQVSSQVGPEEVVEAPAEVMIAATQFFRAEMPPAAYPSAAAGGFQAAPPVGETAVSPTKPSRARKVIVWLLGLAVTFFLTFLGLAIGGGIAEATGLGLPVLICPSLPLILGLYLTARLARGKK